MLVITPYECPSDMSDPSPATLSLFQLFYPPALPYRAALPLTSSPVPIDIYSYYSGGEDPKRSAGGFAPITITFLFIRRCQRESHTFVVKDYCRDFSGVKKRLGRTEEEGRLGQDDGSRATLSTSL